MQAQIMQGDQSSVPLEKNVAAFSAVPSVRSAAGDELLSTHGSAPGSSFSGFDVYFSCINESQCVPFIMMLSFRHQVFIDKTVVAILTEYNVVQYLDPDQFAHFGHSPGHFYVLVGWFGITAGMIVD